MDRASEVLDECMFYRERHRRIFRAMVALRDRGDVVDTIQLIEEVRRRGELEHAGGVEYLTSLMDAVATSAAVDYHARTVLDMHRLRALIEAGTSIVRDGYEPGERSVDVLLDAAESRILQVGATQRASDDMPTIKKILHGTFQQIEELQKAKGGLTGVGTGLVDLDDRTAGLQKGDLVVLAARPSMGKTALATTVALHAATSGQKKVAIFLYEGSKEQLVQRMLCSEALVDLHKMRRGRLADDDYVRLAQAAGHLNVAPMWIEDRLTGPVSEIRSRLRKLKREQGEVDLIIVDYLQLMTEGVRENRNQDVSAISRGLKLVAKEANAPVVALSQLSRAPEQRSDHRPQLSDLRESGSIEQDADLVMFLYRPDYYLSDADAQEKGVAGKTELIIAKQRNGPIGSIDLFFRKESTRFESMTRPGAVR
jgi:replicative DNA helicase